MFNAEQLLGKVMAEMVGSGRGSKKHKKNKGGGKMHSLSSTLLSGKGLMTAIGLGVGAYEILKSKKNANPPSFSPQTSPHSSHPGYGVPAAAATAAVPPPLH